MATVYLFSKRTREYTGETEARTDPKTGNALIPAHGTTTPPPSTGENETAFYEDGVWTVKPDYRGEVYWLDAYTEEFMPPTPDYAGKDLPPGASLTKPEKTQAQLDAERVREIDQRLATIDAESTRALRAKSIGRGAAKDDERLTALEDEAENLRAERANLTV